MAKSASSGRLAENRSTYTGYVFTVTQDPTRELEQSEGTPADRKIILLNRLNEIIYSKEEIQTTFKNLVYRLGEVIPLHHAGMAVVNAEDETFLFHAVESNHPTRLHAGQRFPLTGSCVETVLADRSSKLIRAMKSESSDPLVKSLAEEGFTSMIILPLYLKGTVVGTLHLARKDCAGYARQDLEIIDEVKRQISLVLENSRLLEEPKQRLNNLALINEINKKAATLLDLDDLFTFLVIEIKKGFAFQDVFIVIADSENQEHIFQTTTGSALKIKKARARQKRSQPKGLLSHDRGGIFIEPDLMRQYIPILPTTRSALYAPILIDNDILGEIIIESDRPNDFDPEDLHIIQHIPKDLADIIKNAQMHSQIKALNKQLLRKNTELVSANTRLKRLYEQKSNLLNFVSHELKSPLTAITGYAQLLGQKELGSLNPEQAEVVKDILQICHRLVELTNKTLSQAKEEFDNLRINLRRENVTRCITRVFKQFTRVAKAKDLDLKVDIAGELPDVYCDPDKVEVVLKNLLDNAIKFSNPGCRITLSARTITERSRNGKTSPAMQKLFASKRRHMQAGIGQDFLEVSVIDQAMIIPKKYRRKIFDQYFQIPNRELNAQGSGLGLYLAKQVVEAHNGYIWVENTAEGGNRFTFRLPT
jgi:signal transduction histidine kinase